MTPPGMRSASCARRSATWRFSVSSSSTQGPAMTKSASSRKTRSLIVTPGLGERRHHLAPLRLRLHCRGDEAREQRMRPRRPRLELRMELAADEPRMLRVLDDLDELTVGTHAGELEATLDEHVAILVGHLVAVTMPLADLRRTIDLGGPGPASEACRVRAEPHGPTHVRHVLLRLHQGDDGVVAFRRELGRMAVFEAAYVPRKLDDGGLHAETDAEERQAGYTGMADGFDHPVHPSDSKAAGHKETVI